MTFGTLTLVVLAGLGGPLLSGSRRVLVPLVVGELAAGIVIGRSGLGWLDTGDGTTAFLADAGFAMLMFSAGMHVPVRKRELLTGARRGALAAAIAALLAIPGAYLVTSLGGVHRPALYALLLATGSAAIVVPALEEAGIVGDPAALTVLAQVTLADVVSIVALPLVLEPHRAGRAAAGAVAVAACCVALVGAARLAGRAGWLRGLRKLSKQRAWALDLRVSLLVLFALAWLAQKIGTSVLVAGFGVGLAAAWLGGPKRLTRQVTGVAQGFLVPLFFVVLGARLDLRAFGSHPRLVGLALLLLAANTAVHLLAGAVTRQGTGPGLIATAQIGLPAALVTLGLQTGAIDPGQGAAVLAAALGSLVTTGVGTVMLARRHPVEAVGAGPG